MKALVFDVEWHTPGFRGVFDRIKTATTDEIDSLRLDEHFQNQVYHIAYILVDTTSIPFTVIEEKDFVFAGDKEKNEKRKKAFEQAVAGSDIIIAHNLQGDLNTLTKFNGFNLKIARTFCSCRDNNLSALINCRNKIGKRKSPRLDELAAFCGIEYQLSAFHYATYDAEILYKCMEKLHINKQITCFGLNKSASILPKADVKMDKMFTTVTPPTVYVDKHPNKCIPTPKTPEELYIAEMNALADNETHISRLDFTKSVFSKSKSVINESIGTICPLKLDGSTPLIGSKLIKPPKPKPVLKFFP